MTGFTGIGRIWMIAWLTLSDATIMTTYTASYHLIMIKW